MMDDFILSQMLEMVSENKRNLIEQLAPLRTNHITVVVENIYQSHNASAVVRSCDCFGVRDVHVISTKNTYKVNREVAMGAGKWVNVLHYPNHDTQTCLAELRQKGFRIVATMPHIKGKTIQELSVDKPMALVFGTERSGLSAEAIEMADEYVTIPMYGFAESFNISVSAALCLQIIRDKLLQSTVKWQLSNQELIALQLLWCKNTLRDGEKVYQNLCKNYLTE
jgi:tRNA (guanosine-2'-O-)-methyltransferase